MSFSKKIIAMLAIVLVSGSLPVRADDVEVSATSKVNAKYHQRIKDLGEQIQLLESKGLITKDEAAKFTERQAQLDKSEESVKSAGFQKPATDELEKSITALNADVSKASHKK